MTGPELLLLALAGWSALGLAGVALSVRMGEREKARRNAFWLAGVWGLYAVVLAGFSIFQPQRVVPLGQDRSFGTMCFAVLGVEAAGARMPGDTGAVVRVLVRVANRGRKPEAEAGVRAYLVDAQGRRWDPVPGLGGNALDGRVAGESEMRSEPVFHVAADATGLDLVLTHGAWQPRRLVIGDSESLGHRPTIVRLGR